MLPQLQADSQLAKYWKFFLVEITKKEEPMDVDCRGWPGGVPVYGVLGIEIDWEDSMEVNDEVETG